MRTMKKINMLILFAYVITSFLSAGKIYAFDTIPSNLNNFEVDSLKIIPENPMSDDEVKLIAFTAHTSGDCFLKNYYIHRWGNQFNIDAEYELGDLAVICHSEDTIPIGILPAGDYLLFYGNSDTLFFRVNGDSSVCFANFYYDYPKCYDDAKCGPNSVAFFDSSYADVEKWFWDFGDSTTSTEQNPLHTYEKPGYYNVCLSITTQSGCNSYMYKTVKTSSVECKADFTWSPLRCSPGTRCLGGYHFYDKSVGDAIKWNWAFGDGDSSELQNPMHTYINEGIYLVRLTIQTSEGCIDTKYATLYYGDSLSCGAAFSWKEIFSPIPHFLPTPLHIVQFEDNSYGQVNSWSWDFGDSTYSSEQNPVKYYYTNGPLNVSLGVLTEDSCTSVVEKKIEFNDSLPCKADFTWYYLPGDVIDLLPDSEFRIMPVELPGYVIQFIDMSSGGIESWYWDFGNGYFSDLANPIMWFNDGTYTISLTIKTASGCVETKITTIQVGNSTGCNAEFSWNEVHPDNSYRCKKSTDCITPYYFVEFFPVSLDSSLTYHWDFGDSNYSDEQFPVHEYKFSGTYTVCLTVNGDLLSGCRNTVCKTISVGDSLVLPCNADFTLDTENVPCAKCGMCYCAQFIGISSPNTVDYSWDFGDGDTSFNQNPYHMYNWLPGENEFIVRLTIKTSDRCSDTIFKLYNPETNSLSDIKKNNISYEISIHPNPADGDIFIELSNKSVTGPVTLTIIDLYGRKTDIKNIGASAISDGKIVYNVSHLKKGQYICLISTQNGLMRGKLTVSR